MIVATAGHIDHGKTRLVKVLTGVDTDRLAEEKRRGISIDLGFAHWALPQGGLVGFVDVPGHERFVHNMLAGVCGIDCALIVVAADDGVMPQTIEHLQILNLLSLERSIAVITKVDRVDADRVVQVERQIRALLSGTRFDGCAILPVSSTSGAGIERLRDALIAEAQRCETRHRAGQRFRFAIDRSFVRAGSGRVVTGTVFNGEVRVGDRLVISPSGLAVRVRGLQIHGNPAETARAGDRCALNLAQVDADAVARGDWVMDLALHAPTERMDVHFTLLAAERKPLRHWTQVHLHHATGECLARLSMRHGADILPGTTVWAQIVTDRPIAALGGDRFVLRDESAQRTLGGGVIIDPFSPRARASAARAAMLEAMAAGSPSTALPAMARVADQAIDRLKFERTFNVATTHAAELYKAAGVLVLGRDGPVLVARERADQLRDATLNFVAAFHRSHPRDPGVDARSLRQRVAPWLPTEAFGHLLRILTDAGDLVSHGPLLAMPGHDPSTDATDNQTWQTVLPLLLHGGSTPPTVGELARRLALEPSRLDDLLHRRGRAEDLVQVTEDRWYPKATLAAHAANAALVARLASRGLFSAAQYRDAVGVGRKLAIQILERLDALGITQRVGDLRRMNRNFVPILGSAKPTFRSPPGAKRAGARQTPSHATEGRLRG